jgi:hypothetical protein
MAKMSVAWPSAPQSAICFQNGSSPWSRRLSFIGVAIAMWRKPDVRTPKEKDERIFKGASVAFATIFLSEWGDKGMLSAGAWAATWVTAAETNHTMSTRTAAPHRLDGSRPGHGDQGRIGRDAWPRHPKLDCHSCFARYVRYAAVAATSCYSASCVSWKYSESWWIR